MKRLSRLALFAASLLFSLTAIPATAEDHSQHGKSAPTAAEADTKCTCGPECKCGHSKGECRCGGQAECKCGKECNCSVDMKDCKCGADCRCGHKK